MKTSRRDFLKAASMAFASLFAPKVELGNQVEVNDNIYYTTSSGVIWGPESECQFDVQVHYEQCKEPEARTCENCSTYYFCPHWEKGHVCDTWGYDARIKPGAQIYVTYDKGETWELAGEVS